MSKAPPFGLKGAAARTGDGWDKGVGPSDAVAVITFKGSVSNNKKEHDAQPAGLLIKHERFSVSCAKSCRARAAPRIASSAVLFAMGQSSRNMAPYQQSRRSRWAEASNIYKTIVIFPFLFLTLFLFLLFVIVHCLCCFRFVCFIFLSFPVGLSAS